MAKTDHCCPIKISAWEIAEKLYVIYDSSDKVRLTTAAFE